VVAQRPSRACGRLTPSSFSRCQAWSIAFDFLAQLVRAGPEAMARANLVGWRAEAVALGYQLGSLIFPAVAPVITWAALRRSFIQELIGARSTLRIHDLP
jgi:hypothetical protein